MRIWTEIVGDVIALAWSAIRSEKGVELLDELAQALGAPDPFPNVDGYQGDDNQPTPTPAANPFPEVQRNIRIPGVMNLDTAEGRAAATKAYFDSLNQAKQGE